MIMMVVVGRLGFIQPRYLIAAGAAIACYAMIDLLRMTPDVDYSYFAWSRVYLGIGLPLIFIPITTASYDGIPPAKTDQASALINLARNFGGSMGVVVGMDVVMVSLLFGVTSPSQAAGEAGMRTARGGGVGGHTVGRAAVTTAGTRAPRARAGGCRRRPAAAASGRCS